MVVFALRSASQYALEAVLGLAAVGMFSAAASLAQQPMELVTGALNAYTYPLLLRRYATAGAAGVAEAQTGILLTVTALGAGIVGLIVVACEPAAALVLPPAYRAAAVAVMPWVSVGSFCFALKQFVFDNCFHVAKRNWLQLGSSAASAAIGVAVTIGCVAVFGLPGAAPGFAAASALALLSSAVASRWAISFPIPRFRIAAVVVAAAAAGGSAWAAGPILSGAGPFALLTGTTLAFAAVYVVALTCAGFSLKRLLSTPWAPLRRPIEGPTSAAHRFASQGAGPS
jgi:hypothetical protein